MGAAIPLVVGAAVGLLAAGISGYQRYETAKDEADALDAQAKLELRSAYARERRARREGRLALRRQQLAVTKGGLLLEGSPLEQLSRNTFEVELQALNERTAGINQARYLHWAGRAGVKSARRDLYAGLVTGALTGAAQGFAAGGGTFQQATRVTKSATTGASLLATGPSAYSRIPTTAGRSVLGGGR